MSLRFDRYERVDRLCVRMHGLSAPTELTGMRSLRISRMPVTDNEVRQPADIALYVLQTLPHP